MKDFQKRVIEEKEELDSKIKKLQNFIEEDGDIWNSLNLYEQSDLVDQLEYMKGYTEILQQRINRF